MKALSLLVAAIICASSVCPVMAEALPNQTVSDKVIQHLAKIARQNISHARLNDGSFVPAETAKEQAKPLLPDTTIRRIIEQGVVADMRATCRMDWEKPFYAFMDNEVKTGKLTPKQHAYADLLHGISMGFHQTDIEKLGCKPAFKTYLQQAK